MPPETPIYSDDDGVTVTSTRLIIRQITYSMNHITSVRFIEKQPPTWPVTLIVMGLCVILAGLIFGRRLAGSEQNVFLFMGTLLLGIGLICQQLLKPTYKVIIRTSADESHSIEDRDRQRIQLIMKAINEAFIDRG